MRVLSIRGRSGDNDNETLVADMAVGYKAIRETFTTRVALHRSAMTIDAAYLDGPFRHLDSRWTFTPDGENACRVGFSIDYEFKSHMFAALMGAVFDRAFRKFAEAFEKRADAIYGVGGRSAAV